MIEVIVVLVVSGGAGTYIWEFTSKLRYQDYLPIPPQGSQSLQWSSDDFTVFYMFLGCPWFDSIHPLLPSFWPNPKADAQIEKVLKP
jgi:hypothetical protein